MTSFLNAKVKPKFLYIVCIFSCSVSKQSSLAFHRGCFSGSDRVLSSLVKITFVLWLIEFEECARLVRHAGCVGYNRTEDPTRRFGEKFRTHSIYAQALIGTLSMYCATANAEILKTLRRRLSVFASNECCCQRPSGIFHHSEEGALRLR